MIGQEAFAPIPARDRARIGQQADHPSPKAARSADLAGQALERRYTSGEVARRTGVATRSSDRVGWPAASPSAAMAPSGPCSTRRRTCCSSRSAAPRPCAHGARPSPEGAALKKPRWPWPASSPCCCTASGVMAPSSAGRPHPLPPERRGHARQRLAPAGTTAASAREPRNDGGPRPDLAHPVATLTHVNADPGRPTAPTPSRTFHPAAADTTTRRTLTGGIGEPEGI